MKNKMEYKTSPSILISLQTLLYQPDVVSHSEISRETSMWVNLYHNFVLKICFQGRAADLSSVETAARMIAEFAESDKIVVEKSTVPVQAADSVVRILSLNHKANVSFQVWFSEIYFAELHIISISLFCF